MSILFDGVWEENCMDCGKKYYVDDCSADIGLCQECIEKESSHGLQWPNQEGDDDGSLKNN